MALDVWLGPRGEMPDADRPHRMRRVAEFTSDDPLLVLLNRHWKPFEEAYGPIDPFDSWSCSGELLSALRATLRAARTDAAQRPNAWDEVVGLWHDSRTPIRRQLTRTEALARIDALVAAADECVADAKQLLFLGD